MLSEVIHEFELVHAGKGVEVAIERVNILEDASMALKHSEEIPVLQINGKTHGYWHIDPVRLRAALETLAGGSIEGS